MRTAGNSSGRSNFSRSHEHAPHINACKRRPGDAAVLALYLKRLGTQNYAKTYACASETGRYCHI